MSGKKAKQARRALRERPAILVNAAFAKASAERVLAVDLSAVPVTRATIFIVGWLRNVFEQSRTIAVLAEAGLSHTAASNRRSFAETIVRLQWLHDLPKAERAKAIDAMLDHEVELTKKAFDHIREMGYDSSVDLSEMDEMVTDAAQGDVKNQARQFLAAAKSTQGQSVGLFYAWREESQYSHASGALAAAYANPRDGRMGTTGKPPVADPDLEAHRLATFLAAFLVGRLLIDEGVPDELAQAPALAFFNAY